ncbi:DedA family protein [Marinomonas colpomeniae]|uniref:DedA family protein n=1 Tax=Marinomonas colpomeniae TaxID=2774408 RepID=A0ABR8NTR5_9GAMM|nr:DedA family protein [Marinomonas colpomeniae]MBD5769439.1 DedA family protein [Marinomonas colpomeniae]
MIAELQAFLANGESSILLLSLGIIFLSYLLEDLAIVTAATLATQGVLSPTVGLIAIFIGIATGDLGLYALGRYGRKVRFLRYKALTNKHFKAVRDRLHQGAFLNLFIIRFVPGLRSVGFTMSGFFSIPLPLFLCAVLSATALWTALIFLVIYYLGSQVWLQAAQYQWLIIPIAIGVLFIINRVLNKSLSKGLS